MIIKLCKFEQLLCCAILQDTDSSSSGEEGPPNVPPPLPPVAPPSPPPLPPIPAPEHHPAPLEEQEEDVMYRFIVPSITM